MSLALASSSQSRRTRLGFLGRKKLGQQLRAEGALRQPTLFWIFWWMAHSCSM